MSDVGVRAAAPGDLPRIWELLNGLAAYERWTEFVTGSVEQLAAILFGRVPAAEAIVAQRGERLVGYALFFPTVSSFRTRSMLWLEDLYVEESERGRGTGRLLFAEVARVALERGHARVDWHVLDWNAPSIAFYERLGASRSAADVFTYSLGEDGMRVLAGTKAT